MRRLLLAGSESRWLRRHAPRVGFVKRAVSRFMPGERLEDALEAAAVLATAGLSTIITRLGENVTDEPDAEEMTAHYIDALARVARERLDCQISVKLTQLGLDIDRERCYEKLVRLAAAAAAYGNEVWIDMEQHEYTDVTLELYHRARHAHPNVGVCLQAYLYRTEADLRPIVEAGGRVRLVKGAYREPASVAFPRKRDVDANFLALAELMLGEQARASGFRAVFGTHDASIIRTIQDRAAAAGVPGSRYEFALLYGIQPAVQSRIAREGHRVRVLISYGDYWFPWYMRRLAERPANVWFAARMLWSR